LQPVFHQKAFGTVSVMLCCYTPRRNNLQLANLQQIAGGLQACRKFKIFGCSDPPSVFNELWFPKVMTEKTASCPEFRVVVSTGRRNADDRTLKVYFVLDSSHNLE
jgi:hypothetical protein